MNIPILAQNIVMQLHYQPQNLFYSKKGNKYRKNGMSCETHTWWCIHIIFGELRIGKDYEVVLPREILSVLTSFLLNIRCLQNKEIKTGNSKKSNQAVNIIKYRNKTILALFLVFHVRPLWLCHVTTTLIKILQSHFLFFLIHFSYLIRSQQQRKKKDASRHLTKCKYKFSRVRAYLSIKVF